MEKRRIKTALICLGLIVLLSNALARDPATGVMTFRHGGTYDPAITFSRGGTYDPAITFSRGGTYDPAITFSRGGSRRGSFDFRR